MTVTIGRFEMPKHVIKEESTATSTYAKFLAEPLEQGYAQTLGNSLRRVLLSSIEGAAITSIKIQGVNHEFCAIPGVTEDVTDIILTLKKVHLKMFRREPCTVSLHVKGPGEVTAEHIETDQFIEVMNPAHYIATLAEDGELDAEMEVCIGRGFVAADWDSQKERPIGVIPLDCIFSPVQRVNFFVNNVRVGNRTDYESLTLELWTDERIAPDEALIHAATILRHHLDIFVNYDKDLVQFEEKEKVIDRHREEVVKKLSMSVNEIELSVRAANCLNNANILTVGELAQKNEIDMLKYKNFGKKSLNEIKDKLANLGLSMGMQFEPDLLAAMQKKPEEENE